MYYIEAKFNDSLISLPFNHYINQKKDINFFYTIEILIKKITIALINKNNIEKIVFIFKKNDKIIFSFEENIQKEYIIKFKIEKEYYNFESFLFDIGKKIEKKINEINSYEIILDKRGEEIEKIIKNNEEINLNYFLENIYNKNNNRYYRKINNAQKIFIFECDVNVK